MSLPDEEVAAVDAAVEGEVAGTNQLVDARVDPGDDRAVEYGERRPQRPPGDVERLGCTEVVHPQLERDEVKPLGRRPPAVDLQREELVGVQPQRAARERALQHFAGDHLRRAVGRCGLVVAAVQRHLQSGLTRRGERNVFERPAGAVPVQQVRRDAPHGHRQEVPEDLLPGRQRAVPGRRVGQRQKPGVVPGEEAGELSGKRANPHDLLVVEVVVVSHHKLAVERLHEHAAAVSRGQAGEQAVGDGDRQSDRKMRLVSTGHHICFVARGPSRRTRAEGRASTRAASISRSSRGLAPPTDAQQP